MSQALQTSHPRPVWTAGDYMLKARRDAELEQTDVAKALGVSRSLVGKWEHNKSNPDFPTLVKFVKLTGAYWLVEALQALSDKSGSAGQRHLSVASRTKNPRPSKTRTPLLNPLPVPAGT